MLRPLFLILLMALCAVVRSQDSTAVKTYSELEKRNGFKDIKLGMAVDSLKGIKFKKDFKERKEFDAKLYEVENPAYESIGEVKIKKVEVKAYKGLIYEISVTTGKDTRVMKALESIYGQASYDAKNEQYLWSGKDLVLRFFSPTKSNLEMVYISFLIHGMMKNDKAQKVNDIANDF